MQVTSFGFPIGTLSVAPMAGTSIAEGGFAQSIDRLLAPGPCAPAPDAAMPGAAPEAVTRIPAAALAQLLPVAPATQLPTVAHAPVADMPPPEAASAAVEEPLAQRSAKSDMPMIDTGSAKSDMPMIDTGTATPVLPQPPVGAPRNLPATAIAEAADTSAPNAPAVPVEPSPEPRLAIGTKPAIVPRRIPKGHAEARPAIDQVPEMPTLPAPAVTDAAAGVTQPVGVRTAPVETLRAAGNPDMASAPVVRGPVPVDAAAPKPRTPATTADINVGPAPVMATAGRGDRQENGAAPDRHSAPEFTIPHRSPAGDLPIPVPSANLSHHAPGTVHVHEPEITARPGHLGQALGVEIARKAALGEETLRVRLNPGALGRVEVTLAFDDGGSLRATVRAESVQALDLLRQDAADLTRTLDQAGIRADAQSFRFESRTGGDGGTGPQQQQQQQHPHRPGRLSAGGDEAEPATPVWQAMRGDGQVDLLA